MSVLGYVKEILKNTLESMDIALPEKTKIEPPREKKFGDVATNVAMLLASQLKDSPRNIATKIKDKILDNYPEYIENIEIAGPGFMNFHIKESFWQKGILSVFKEKEEFGKSSYGKGQKVLIEYVSANPTGPLHVGHGRGAAVGDSLARILRFCGYDVKTEYYINDAGRQIKLLGKSIYIRYRQQFGFDDEICDECYKGDYINDIAREIREKFGDNLLKKDEEDAVEFCSNYGKDVILDVIKRDLELFGVEHEVWFSEKSLFETKEVEATIDLLKKKGLIYEKDGAIWFNSLRFGDDKDRVIRKSSGDYTYFASDIAYHKNKLDRGFDLLIDIWGADHHGYIPRMKAAIEALGRDKDDLKIILIQLVNLLREGQQVSMSTRAGEFVTLKDVINEVGVDAARFIFLSRKSDSHLDFDLELAKQKTMENPVFYVQYAHARICSVFQKAKERDIGFNFTAHDVISLLLHEQEIDLMKKILEFKEIVKTCARLLSPHFLTFYLLELAGLFHQYYNNVPILGAEDEKVIVARIYLLRAIKQVLKSGLSLLGVSAPERM